MNEIEALQILTEEMIESHARCHYPYGLNAGPASIPRSPTDPKNPDAGVYITIESQVFGPISSASATSFQLAIIALAKNLMSTREERWATETRSMK
jgi:hypothetical protein